MVTASLTNYRQSPRKVRLVATLIKGKTVDQALNMLGVTTKRASDPLAKLLLSAVANAKNLGVSMEGLYIKECTVNSGFTMKRHMPGSRGTAFPIRKKTSHVNLVLDTKAVKAPKVKAASKATK
ncbi:MAG: 50S ribosomal protein L22 [bacterium]|nr:50S ribosomal protein L22 [bacterium]